MLHEERGVPELLVTGACANLHFDKQNTINKLQERLLFLSKKAKYIYHKASRQYNMSMMHMATHKSHNSHWPKETHGTQKFHTFNNSTYQHCAYTRG